MIWKAHLPNSFQLMQMPEISCRVLRHVYGFCHYGHASLQVNKCHPVGLSLEAHKSCFSLFLHGIIGGKLSQVRKDEATHLADLEFEINTVPEMDQIMKQKTSNSVPGLGAGQ